jgi:hypothetical protein
MHGGRRLLGRRKNGKKKRNISKICYFVVSFYVSIMRNIF